MFRGAITAIVTPWREGEVDLTALGEALEEQLAQGTQAVVVYGTTGEGATLTDAERDRILTAAVEQCRGKMPVIAGTGSNDTGASIRLTLHARERGADGALIVTPYYNKPMPEGLYRHYAAVLERTDIPIILYNVPGRTACAMQPETAARLAEHEKIVGLKDASGSTEFFSRLMSLTDLPVLSGDDVLTLPLMALGAVGVISVAGNIVPRDVRALVDACAGGDYAAARAAHAKLYPLCRALFLESNPIPVKAALRQLGRGNGELRLPLSPMSEVNEARLARALEEYGLTPKVPRT